MRCIGPRLLLLGVVLLSTSACATSRERTRWSAQPFQPTLPEHHVFAMTTRVSLPLAGAAREEVAREHRRWSGQIEEPAVPDIGGRWMGIWSGFGVMARRMSTAQAEFIQAGRWGWGKIALADTLAADVPVIVTYRGALGVPVVFDVFQAGIVVKHEAGGSHLTAVFRIDGDRMVGTLRGYDTLIVLARQR